MTDDRLSKALAVLQRSHPRYTGDRLAAIVEITDLPLDAEGRAQAAQVLEEIVSGRRVLPRLLSVQRLLGGPVFGGAAVGFFTGLMLAATGKSTQEAGTLAQILVSAGLVGVLFGILLSFYVLGTQYALGSDETSDRVRGACARALGVVGGREAIVPLSECCRQRDTVIQYGAFDGLRALLPRCLEPGAQSFTPEMTCALAHALPVAEIEVELLILQCLAEQGDPSSLPRVRPLLTYRQGRAPAREALETIRRLEERLEEERRYGVLLRPVRAENSTTLLHAITSSGGADEAMLLRPAVEE